MQDLRISLVQGATRWHDPAGNRDYYGDLIAPLHGHTDLVLLPETFTSGFSNDAIDQAETMDGPTLAWMREQAAALDAAVTGSVQLRVETAGGPGGVNRMPWVTAEDRTSAVEGKGVFVRVSSRCCRLIKKKQK